MSSFVGVCIICLANNKDLKRLFELDCDNVRMMDKLKYCFDHVVYDDNHCSICITCGQELHKSFEFKKMFLANQDRLKNYLSHCRTCSIEPTLENETFSGNVGNTPDVERATYCVIGEEVYIKQELPEFVENMSQNAKEELSEKTISVNLQETRPYIQTSTVDADTFIPLMYVSVKEEHVNAINSSEYTGKGTGLRGYITEEISAELEGKKLSRNLELEALHANSGKFCAICDGSFSLRAYLQTLEQEIAKTGQEDLYESLDQEVKSEHIEYDILKPSTCPICRKDFKYKCQVKVHMTVHTGAKPYTCEICHKQFSQRSNLKVHRQTIHTGLKPFSCTECRKQFTRIQHLDRHMRVHTGAKPYSCKECGKQFSLMENLKRHMTVHTAAKPYICSVCQKQFSLMELLKRHMVIHMIEKPYNCNECQKSFRRKTDLEQHLTLHTGSLPYTCEVCSKKFRLSRYLKSHMINHSGIKPFECNGCHKRFNLNASLKRHLAKHRCKPLEMQLVPRIVQQ